MVKKTNWVGDTLATWATDFWPDGYSFDMLVVAEQHPVREAEFNFMQQNEWLKLRDHIRRMITDGWTVLGAFSFPGNADNSFLMGESWVNASGQTLHIGNPSQSQNTSKIQLAAPPSGAGTRTDFVYLEMFLVEVAAPQSSDAGGVNVTDRTIYQWGGLGNATYADQTWWETASQETARRVQIRWAIRVAQFPSGTPTLTGLDAQAQAASSTTYTFAPLAGSSTLWVAGDGTLAAAQALGVVDGYCYAFPIAGVARVGGQAVIQSAAVTDLRAAVQLQPGITIPPANIIGGVGVDPDLVHLTGAHFVYTGSQLAGYVPPISQGQAQTTLSTAAAHWATRLLLPAGVQSVTFYQNSGSEVAFPSNNDALTRVTVNLALLGSGADITVEIHSDGTTVPAPTILASATIPAAWLLSQARDISFCLPTTALAPNAAVWVVVKKAGAGGNGATLYANAQTDANAAAATSTDGATWTAAGGLPFQCALFTGTTGNMVHAQTPDGGETLLFEYDAQGQTLRIGEHYAPTGYTPFAKLVQAYYDASTGNILDLA